MSDSAQRAWYEALRDMCGDLKSDEVADIIISAGLSKSRNRATVSAHVRACLNPNKQEFFKISEIIVLTKYTRCFQVVAFLNEQVGCKPPVLLSGELAANAPPAAGGLDITKLNELRQMDKERRSRPSLSEQTLFSQDAAES